jgi:hypothetical protein
VLFRYVGGGIDPADFVATMAGVWSIGQEVMSEVLVRCRD